MKWKPPGDRSIAIALAPIWIPATAVFALAILPMIATEWLSARWRKWQTGKGTRDWFAWYPVKFDGFWEDQPSEWMWLETVRYVNFGRGEWRYLPLGYRSQFEPTHSTPTRQGGDGLPGSGSAG